MRYLVASQSLSTRKHLIDILRVNLWLWVSPPEEVTAHVSYFQAALVFLVLYLTPEI